MGQHHPQGLVIRIRNPYAQGWSFGTSWQHRDATFPSVWCSRLEMKKVEANPYTTSYNLDPQEYTIPLSLCVYVGEKGPDWQIVSLNKMAFFSGRRHLRSKALVMAAAANNHSQPQVFRFVKMRNPPKSLKIFHLCRKPMQNEVPQFGDTIRAAPRKLGCCYY